MAISEEMALQWSPSQIQTGRWNTDKFWGRAPGRRPPSKKSDPFWGTSLLKPFLLVFCSSCAVAFLSFCHRNNHIMYYRDTLYESGLAKGTEPMGCAYVCMSVSVCVMYVKGFIRVIIACVLIVLTMIVSWKVTQRPSIWQLYSPWDWMSYLRSHNLVSARLWEVFSLHWNLAVATGKWACQGKWGQTDTKPSLPSMPYHVSCY